MHVSLNQLVRCVIVFIITLRFFSLPVFSCICLLHELLDVMNGQDRHVAQQKEVQFVKGKGRVCVCVCGGMDIR